MNHRGHRGPPADAAGAAAEQDSLLSVIRENVDGMLVIGHDGVIMLANPAAERLLGRPAEGLIGTSFGAPLALDTATEIDVVAGGSPRTAEMRVVAVEWYGRPALLASLRDVTDRKEAEEVLARVGGQHAAIAQLGKDAVSGFLPETLLAEGAKQIRRVLHADFAGVFVTPPDDRGLRLVASERSQELSRPIGEPGDGTQPAYTLGTSEPIVMVDARSEARFEGWPSGLASAVTVRMQSGEQRYGVIEASFRLPRRLEPDEITFLQSVANLLAAAVARFRAERQMRHQALHDPLTGLPNRGLFLDRLEHALALSDATRSDSRSSSQTSMASRRSTTTSVTSSATTC